MIGRFLYIITNISLFLLIVIILLVAGSFLPIENGYKIFTVVSGSMEPSLKQGSLIFSRPQEDYSVGDIVTYKPDNSKTTITHRIIEKKEKNGEIIFRIKGDANEVADMNFAKQRNIVGKVILAIQYLGYPVSFSKTPLGLILVIMIPAGIVIYREIIRLVNYIF